MSEENNYDYKAIDAVVNIWTREALSQRPDWGDDFFVGKMNAKDSLMTGLSFIVDRHHVIAPYAIGA